VPEIGAAAALPQHRDQLIEMAKTWDLLADQREAELARQKRLQSLAETSDTPTREGA
jgi:hypothetical protein